MSLLIRPAQPGDVETIVALIRELADYEKLLSDVVITPEGLHEQLFGEPSVIEVLMAEWEGEAVGFALFFHNFSTFLGRPGLYLEDLFVRPAFRGKGIGKALLTRLAQLAVERKCGRFEWSVLDWNEPSIQFYKSQGAVPMDEWTTFRVTGDALARLAGAVSV
ncbi:MAG: N-acetyltransferase family protein [Bacteroidota bacterium]